MPAAWPVLVDALVTLLPGLPGWHTVAVYDGQPVTADDAREWATVAYVSTDDESAGDYRREESTISGQVDESGTVRVELVLTDGEAEALPSLRARGAVLTDTVALSLRTDPTLGVLPYMTTIRLDVEVRAAQTSDGPSVSFVLALSYTTVTTP